MKKLRILYVTSNATMQGANQALLELIVELWRRGLVEPVVLMPRVADAYAGNNLRLACNEHQIACYSYPFYCFQGRKRWPSYARCLTNLLCYPYIWYKLRKQHFDLIHSNSSVCSLGGYLSRIKRVPHVWHFREAAALHYGTVSLPGRRYERFIYGMGDVFVAISKALMGYCANVVDASKLRLVYDGVDCSVDPTVARHDGDTFQLCMVGLMNEPKNQLDALRALDVLVNKWGERRLHLTFIGPEEKVYAGQIRVFAEQKGLSSYVTFLGERRDVADLLPAMDVGLMLSRFEAFGRVTVEYMLHGLAVIATDTGANTEIVENGKTGLICPLGDYCQLAEHIRSLMTDRQMLTDFAQHGRQRALSLFASDRNATEIYDVYTSLLSRKQGTTVLC